MVGPLTQMGVFLLAWDDRATFKRLWDRRKRALFSVQISSQDQKENGDAIWLWGKKKTYCEYAITFSCLALLSNLQRGRSNKCMRMFGFWLCRFGQSTKTTGQNYSVWPPRLQNKESVYLVHQFRASKFLFRSPSALGVAVSDQDRKKQSW